jgi:multidrug resistance efflux pump
VAQPTLIRSGIDRVQTAFHNVDREMRRLQKQAERRRRDFEKRAEKQVKRLRSGIARNAVVQRAADLREGTLKAIEGGVGQILGSIGIASAEEIRKLDRKVAQLNRKVRELEQTSGSEA